MAEKVLDEVAKNWKNNGGGVIVSGEADDLKSILRVLERSMNGGRPSQRECRSQDSLRIGQISAITSDSDLTHLATRREDCEGNSAMLAPVVTVDGIATSSEDPRRWLKVIGAFEQPRLLYNVSQKRFEAASDTPALLPDPSHKTHFFRHRYNTIYQRLLRNESFQSSAVASARTSSLHRPPSIITTTQQAYKLTSIANLLGRSGSSHLLLGLLTVSPTGALTVSDLTGNIALDIVHAKPVPEDGAWFTPGMIVLVDGVYEEDCSSTGLGLDGNFGVGGTISGKFIAFSIGGPPCERREMTIGISGANKGGHTSTGGGFGWVDFLGVGSERAAGSAMRNLETHVLAGASSRSLGGGRARIIICGEVELDKAKTLRALKQILGLYAAEQADQTPMAMIFMGNFVEYAVMRGGSSGGSIEYKEYFDSLASTISDYPTILQNSTFVFVPGDNDPWVSALSGGAASALPRNSVPDIFTSRIRRAFARAASEAEKAKAKKADGEAIWSTNPMRLTLFGPTQEVVFFRDNISGRLRRTALRFRPSQTEAQADLNNVEHRRESQAVGATETGQALDESLEVDSAIKTAESQIPIYRSGESAKPGLSSDVLTARKLVKTIVDQGYLSPFPTSDRPVLWDYAGALQLYPLPTALVLMDPEVPPFAITYEGCHVMNPGPLTPQGKKGVAQWMEYDATTRRGRTREIWV